MLKNYIIIAWRNLWKHISFSIINILGLSAGIAFTLLIGSYVWEGLQVNRGLKNGDRQYVILSKWKDPNMGIEDACIPELTRELKARYPGLVANYYNASLAVTNISNGDKHFRERVLVGDSTLLSMYGFKLLNGDAQTALQGMYSLVITSKMALKYFGKTDVAGQTLNLEDFAGGNHDYMITGVLGNIPENTVTGLNGRDNFQFFINGSANHTLRTNLSWDNTSTVDHIELRNGADPKTVEAAMLKLLQSSEAEEEIKKNLTPYLVPLKDYYLQANNGLVKKMSWTLTSIAIFILLMALVNFVNICIGRSSGRMKEMGIRKAVGGLRKQLIAQFLTESVIMVLLATVLAFLIYPFARQYFGAALGRELMGLSNLPVYFFLFFLLFALFAGLLAGVYPAIVLSAMGTVESLKGKSSSVREKVWLRKTLVAFQFITAAIVFIGAIIISQQVSLFFHGNLGYNKDYVIYAQAPRDWSAKGVQKMEAIRYRIAQLPEVSNISLSWEIPDGMDWEMRKTVVYRQGANPSSGFNTQHLIADNQYAATFGIPLKAGSFFSPVALPGDSLQAVINETELHELGWNDPREALGQKVIFQESSFTITGVTEDFHFGSLQKRIQPILFTHVNDADIYRYLSIKLKPGNMQGSLEAVQRKWSEVMPGAPFEYSFMDDALEKLYATEIQLKKAAYIATGLAFVIVLLGVLGLISLSIQKRTREIGIRKILGSSVAGITALFLKDFLSIVLIAGAVACPLAYIIMRQWLSDYAYRINISLAPFVISIGLLSIITAVIIALQTMKAAFANPVKSLKND